MVWGNSDLLKPFMAARLTRDIDLLVYPIWALLHTLDWQ